MSTSRSVGCKGNGRPVMGRALYLAETHAENSTIFLVTGIDQRLKPRIAETAFLLVIVSDGGESGILSSPLVQTLCIQQNATNRSPYRHLGSITSGTVVTEKTLINPRRPDCSMDGMDSIFPVTPQTSSCINTIRHDPLAVSRSQAQRTLFGKLIPEPMHVTAVKVRGPIVSY